MFHHRVWNLQAKNCEPAQPPAPVRQASVDKTASGADQCMSGIYDIPLKETRNLFHQNKSFRNSIPILNFWPWLFRPLKEASNLEKNILELKTHFETNDNLPTRDCNSCFDARSFVSHKSINSEISRNLDTQKFYRRAWSYCFTCCLLKTQPWQ